MAKGRFFDREGNLTGEEFELPAMKDKREEMAWDARLRVRHKVQALSGPEQTLLGQVYWAFLQADDPLAINRLMNVIESWLGPLAIGEWPALIPVLADLMVRANPRGAHPRGAHPRGAKA